ncbi:uncharacterized protein LOC135931430 [Gordionus sp. m RMFG-2023]|uniref:uncharacterized protein LOC135931430 n=1 Tax=Gordionus sp. m RMFG-2023 TaxID=3053472 RepID=UPI0031FDC8C3
MPIAYASLLTLSRLVSIIIIHIILFKINLIKAQLFRDQIVIPTFPLSNMKDLSQTSNRIDQEETEVAETEKKLRREVIKYINDNYNKLVVGDIFPPYSTPSDTNPPEVSTTLENYYKYDKFMYSSMRHYWKAYLQMMKERSSSDLSSRLLTSPLYQQLTIPKQLASSLFYQRGTQIIDREEKDDQVKDEFATFDNYPQETQDRLKDFESLKIVHRYHHISLPYDASTLVCHRCSESMALPNTICGTVGGIICPKDYFCDIRYDPGFKIQDGYGCCCPFPQRVQSTTIL